MWHHIPGAGGHAALGRVALHHMSEAGGCATCQGHRPRPRLGAGPLRHRSRRCSGSHMSGAGGHSRRCSHMPGAGGRSRTCSHCHSRRCSHCHSSCMRRRPIARCSYSCCHSRRCSHCHSRRCSHLHQHPHLHWRLHLHRFCWSPRGYTFACHTTHMHRNAHEGMCQQSHGMVCQ